MRRFVSPRGSTAIGALHAPPGGGRIPGVLTPAIVVMALGLLVAMYMQLLCGGSRLRSGVRWFCQIVVTLGQDAIQHGRDFHSHCCTLPRAHAALLTLQWLGPTGHVSLLLANPLFLTAAWKLGRDLLTHSR